MGRVCAVVRPDCRADYGGTALDGGAEMGLDSPTHRQRGEAHGGGVKLAVDAIEEEHVKVRGSA
jgi:hypothetical protein